MKLALIIVIVALLGSVVGYLAMDRHDKTVETQHEKNFEAKYFK